VERIRQIRASIGFLPSPGGGGSTRLKGAAGWGDGLSARTVPELREHPAPSRILRCEPTLPLQGRVSMGMPHLVELILRKR
jgi:hypothetical protein